MVAVAAVHVVVEALVVTHVDVVFFWGIFAGFEFVVVVAKFVVAQTFSKTVVREVIINKMFFVLLGQVF